MRTEFFWGNLSWVGCLLSGCFLRQKQDSVSQPTPGCQRADTWPAFVLWGAMNVLPEQGVRADSGHARTPQS